MNDGRISTQENFSDDEIELINMFTQEAEAMPAPSVTKADVLARAQREARSSGSSNGRAATIGRGFAVAASLAVLAGGTYLGTRGSDTTPVIPATPSTTSSTVVDAPAVSPTDYLVATIANANGKVTVELVDAETGKRVRTIQTVEAADGEVALLLDSLQYPQVADDGTVYGLLRQEPNDVGTDDQTVSDRRDEMVAIQVDGTVTTIVRDVTSFQLFASGGKAAVIVESSPSGKFDDMVSSLEIVDLETLERQVVRREAPAAVGKSNVDPESPMLIAAVTPDEDFALIAQEYGDSHQSTLVSLSDRDRVIDGEDGGWLISAQDRTFESNSLPTLVATEGEGSATSYVFHYISWDQNFVNLFVRVRGDGTLTVLDDSELEIVRAIRDAGQPEVIDSSSDGVAVTYINWDGTNVEPGKPYNVSVQIISGSTARELNISLDAREELRELTW